MEHAVNLATSNMDLNHLLEGARHDGYRGHLAKLNLILVSVALPSPPRQRADEVAATLAHHQCHERICRYVIVPSSGEATLTSAKLDDERSSDALDLDRLLEQPPRLDSGYLPCHPSESISAIEQSLSKID